MIIPVPAAGLVVRYGFLWSDEHAAGLVEGKDRPCVILAAIRRPTGEVAVLLAPITHSSSDDEDDTSLPVDPALAAHLGLDPQRHWFRLHELNKFIWPGFDLRAIPRGRGEVTYGMLPPDVFERVLDGVRKLDAKRRRVQLRD